MNKLILYSVSFGIDPKFYGSLQITYERSNLLPREIIEDGMNVFDD